MIATCPNLPATIAGLYNGVSVCVSAWPQARTTVYNPRHHPKHSSFHPSQDGSHPSALPQRVGTAIRAWRLEGCEGWGLLSQSGHGAEIIFSLLAISQAHTYTWQIQQFYMSMMALRRNLYRKCKCEEALDAPVVVQESKKRKRSGTVDSPVMRVPAKIPKVAQ